MVIWKWISKQELYVRVIALVGYFYFFVYLIDVIVSIVSYFKRKEVLTKNRETERQVDKFIRDYLDKKDKEFMETQQLKISKKINFDTRKFLIDTENKKFGFYISSYDRYKYTLFIDLIYDKMDALSLDHTIVVEPNSFKDEVFKEFKSYTNDIYPCEIYNFSDLNRVELFDKSRTDENRIYTIQDKSGDALWGAIGGSLLSKTRFNEYATAGAIIGASGERKITENVKRDTHIEFCVTLYLNDIKHPYESFSVKNENKLHEFIGALEYIKNNK